MKHPWIRQADVEIRFQNRVSITIQEQEPVLLLASDYFWYINDSGVVFRRAASDNMDFPVLTGINPTVSMNIHTLHSASSAMHCHCLKPWTFR